MTVTVKVLVEAKDAEAAQTTQYTATNVTALIDKFTATNHTGVAVTFSVNIVPVAAVPDNTNVIAMQRILQGKETYTFPELVGQTLAAGDFISTLASAHGAVNFRVSGREVS